MASELWEIVRADQVKVGDVVLAGSPEEYDEYEVRSIKRVEDEDGEVEIHFGHGGIYPDRYNDDESLFRRVDPADDPRVLRRALEIQEREMVNACIGNPIDEVIDQARRELESEAGNGTAR